MPRMTRAMWACGALVVTLAACPRPAPAPDLPKPPPDAAIAPDVTIVEPLPLERDYDKLAKRGVLLYQEVANAFAAAGTDCATATEKLRVLLADYKDVVVANAKVLRDGHAKELRTALEPHAEALDSAAKKIVGSATMATCSTDRAFTSTFDELVGAPP